MPSNDYQDSDNIALKKAFRDYSTNYLLRGQEMADKIIIELLNNGANPDQEIRAGTLLMHAVQFCSNEVVVKMTEKITDINLVYKEFGQDDKSVLDVVINDLYKRVGDIDYGIRVQDDNKVKILNQKLDTLLASGANPNLISRSSQEILDVSDMKDFKAKIETAKKNYSSVEFVIKEILKEDLIIKDPLKNNRLDAKLNIIIENLAEKLLDKDVLRNKLKESIKEIIEKTQESHKSDSLLQKICTKIIDTINKAIGNQTSLEKEITAAVTKETLKQTNKVRHIMLDTTMDDVNGSTVRSNSTTGQAIAQRGIDSGPKR